MGVLHDRRVHVFFAPLYVFSIEAQTEVLKLFHVDPRIGNAACTYNATHDLFEIVCVRGDVENTKSVLKDILSRYIEAQRSSLADSKKKSLIQPVSRILQDQEDFDLDDDPNVNAVVDLQESNLLGDPKTLETRPRTDGIPVTDEVSIGIAFLDDDAERWCATVAPIHTFLTQQILQELENSTSCFFEVHPPDLYIDKGYVIIFHVQKSNRELARRKLSKIEASHLECPSISHLLCIPMDNVQSAISFLSLGKLNDGTLGRILLPPDTILNTMDKLCKACVCRYSSYSLARQTYINHKFSPGEEKPSRRGSSVNIWSNFDFRQIGINNGVTHSNDFVTKITADFVSWDQEPQRLSLERGVRKWRESVEPPQDSEQLSGVIFQDNSNEIAKNPNKSLVKSEAQPVSSRPSFINDHSVPERIRDVHWIEREHFKPAAAHNKYTNFSRETNWDSMTEPQPTSRSTLDAFAGRRNRAYSRHSGSVVGCRGNYWPHQLWRNRAPTSTNTLISFDASTSPKLVSAPPGYAPFVAYEDANSSCSINQELSKAEPIDSDDISRTNGNIFDTNVNNMQPVKTAVQNVSEGVIDRLQSSDDEERSLSSRVFMRTSRQQRKPRHKTGFKTETGRKNNKLSTYQQTPRHSNEKHAYSNHTTNLVSGVGATEAQVDITFSAEDINTTFQDGVISSTVSNAAPPNANSNLCTTHDQTILSMSPMPVPGSKTSRKMHEKNLYLAGVHKSVSAARKFRGRVNIEVQLGQVLVSRVPKDLRGNFNPEEFLSCLSEISDFDRLSGNFSVCITSQASDIERLLYVITAPDSDSIEKGGWWEITCSTSISEEIKIYLPALENGLTDFEPYFLDQPSKLLGAVYFHFPHKIWDARFVVVGTQPRSLNSSELVEEFVKSVSIRVFAKENGMAIPILEAKELKTGLRVENVLLRTSIKYDARMEWDQCYLNITRVHDMVIMRQDANIESGGIVCAKAREELEMVEEKALWYEVSLGMKKSTGEFKENENLAVGEFATWTTEQVVNDEHYASLQRVTRKLVENMDDVGLSNKGWGIEHERKVREQIAKQEVEDNVYW